MESVNERRHYTLGVLEHGMYSKRMCKHGRPLLDLFFLRKYLLTNLNSKEVKMSKEESDSS